MVVADPVVGVGVDVAQVGAVELLERPVELRLRRRRLGRPVLVARLRLAHRCKRSLAPRQAALRARSARRSPAIHSPASISPSISAASPSRLGASMPAAGHRLGDQRHRVEPLRRLADAARDLVRGDAGARAARRPGGCGSRAPARSRSGRPTPASPENVSSRAPLRERELDALAPDAGGGDPRGVEAEALGGRRGRARRRSWPRRRSRPRRRRRCARRPARRGRRPRPACARRSGSVLPSTSAAIPAAASRACAGPPSEAIARARTRSETYSFGSAPMRLDEALGEQQHRGARADPVRQRADDVRAARTTAPRGRSGRSRRARSRWCA